MAVSGPNVRSDTSFQDFLENDSNYDNDTPKSMKEGSRPVTTATPRREDPKSAVSQVSTIATCLPPSCCSTMATFALRFRAALRGSAYIVPRRYNHDSFGALNILKDPSASPKEKVCMREMTCLAFNSCWSLPFQLLWLTGDAIYSMFYVRTMLNILPGSGPYLRCHLRVKN
jgi:hypothetical protein